MGDFRLLIVNPGSTTTKVSIYDGDEQARHVALRHTPTDLAGYSDILDQYAYRKEVIYKVLAELGEDSRAAWRLRP